MIDIVNTTESGAMHVRISDRISEDEYGAFVPKFNAFIAQHGKVRVLIEMSDFHGWSSLKALWRDVRFDMRVNPKVERTAMVGEKTWQGWVARLSKPFAKGDLRYYDASELNEAWDWVAPNHDHERAAMPVAPA